MIKTTSRHSKKRTLTWSFCLLRRSMKIAKTYEEQIEILKTRNLIIENEDGAIKALSTMNYYSLTGYLYQFKDKSGNYINGTTLEQGIALYKFDRELSSIILYFLNEIEQTIKTIIAYVTAFYFPDNPCFYKDSSCFSNPTEHKKFISEFNKAVHNNKDAKFVKHHMKNYDGNFPIWVAIQLFTLGNIKHFYKNMPNNTRKSISKEFDVAHNTLDNWIENLRLTRNLTAHNMRIYGNTSIKTPILSGKIENKNNTNRIFAQFLLFKILVQDKISWTEKIVQLNNLIGKNSKYLDLNQIGFPESWFEILTK